MGDYFHFDSLQVKRLGYLALLMARREVAERAHRGLGDFLAVAGRDDGAHQGLDAAHLAHCHLKKTKNKIIGIFQIRITLVF